jgi:methyl-accepting chemotaxis protein
MENKRKSILMWKTKLSKPFIIVSVCSMLLFTLVFAALVASTMSSEMGLAQSSRIIWSNSFLKFLLIQLGANIFLLFIIFNTLNRSVGAFPRIGNILDKVIAGDHTVRIGLRKKDYDHVVTLATKINKVLEILEAKAKQK